MDELKEFCLGKICYLDPGQENWTTITYIVPDCVCGQCPNAGASVPCAECGESLSESGGQCMNPCHAYKLEYKASVRAECCCNDIMIGDCTKWPCAYTGLLRRDGNQDHRSEGSRAW